MKYYVQIFVYFVLQHLPFIGSVTIDFNSIGYIGESTVLQCQDTPPITAVSATWYRGGSLMDISSSRYSQTKTTTGFNLTISSLVTADGGVFHCGIDFEISTPKSLYIYYNTKDVTVTKLYPHAMEITFIAFPDPVYVATVKQDGVHLDVHWTVYKSIQASGAIMFLLRNSTVFTYQTKVYTVHVNITSPVSLDVERNITWVSDLTAQRFDDSAPKVILAFAICIGIISICFGVILLKFGVKKPSAHGSRKFILGIGFSIMVISCITFSMIMATIGDFSALELGLGIGLGFVIPILGSIIVIVILVKKVVNIQAKYELRKPIPEGSEVTITASIDGFFTSCVRWIGPQSKYLTSNEKYNIKYNRETGISTLQISALKTIDSGHYICRAEGGFSAQDFVTISVNDCKLPTESEQEKSLMGLKAQMRSRKN